MIRNFALGMVCTGVTLLGVVTGPVAAATFNLGNLIDSNGSFTVGDKLFSDFTATIDCQPAVCNPAFVGPIDPDSISVTTLDTGLEGIRFSGPFFADANNAIDVLIGYSVEALDPNMAISDIHLAFNGQPIPPPPMGNSRTSVVETVFDLDNNIIGQTFVSNPPPILNNAIDLDKPVKKAKVVKDIQLKGGTTGIATISFIDQRVSQTKVPEPGTVGSLVLFGLCGMGLILKRQREQSVNLRLGAVSKDNHNVIS
ncbi:PEP-CTERM sorting domain-containing protein [Aerosakkonema sp. BLCC-F183]|uniref:PEP-CTERM sorting domain-containing protein n=1 Tax=Aerosakkonema sp. BLCC-F183 TaxID=3342834 RepID=UPI0035B8D951